MGTAEWITNLVAALALVVSGLGLSRSMRNDLRMDARTEGATDQLIEDIRARLELTNGVAETARSLRQDVDALKTVTAETARTLQEHLLKCERASGRIEEQMKGFAQGQTSLQNSVEGVQRMIANWMRDKERRDGVAG